MKSAARLFAFAIAVGAVTPALASVFVNHSRWPAGSSGFTIIPVCIVSGSSAEQKGYGADSGLIHDPNPSLAQVITHVRIALSQSWENFGNVRFTGWQPCETLSSSAQANAVGLYINKDASDESITLGVGTRGFINPGAPGVQFKPFGPSFAKCVKYDASTTHVAYTFDCAEQYGIHEFGHVLGFAHEWESPAKPSTCIETSFSGSHATYFDLAFETTIVNPQSYQYDWDSIMTYNSDCAHVTGVRFGSKRLSQWDILGVQAVYAPVFTGFHDIGVLAGSGGCGQQDMLYVYMDAEDDHPATSASGWRGATIVDSNVNFAFCRVDGDFFGKISAPNGAGDYATLLLGQTCPAGSTEFVRDFDNEDQHNENYIAGNAQPNLSNGSRTELHFCLFRAENPGSYLMTNFPLYSFDYGVFAASSFVKAISTGSIHVDDEDDHNADSWTYYDSSMESAVSRLMSGGNNTDMQVAQVMAAGVPLTVNIQPPGTGIVNPPSGSLFPQGASVSLLADPSPGYKFTSWQGPAVPLNTAAANIMMLAPMTVTAHFEVLGTTFAINITAKSGPANARVWTVSAQNQGPGAAPGLAVNTFQLLQDSGTACTPVVKDSLPKNMAEIAPGASTIVPITIDFSGCEAAARFRLVFSVKASSGASASRTLFNQFR
jgi:hypothetical protein